MKEWFVSPVFWVILSIAVCLMFWRDRTIPKLIARWLNKAGVWVQECFAVLNASQGMAVYKSISAIVFIFRPGRDEDAFTLKSCSGWVKYAGRFQESQVYEFTFDNQLTAGYAQVLLMDGEQKEILKLDRHLSVGRAELEAGVRYYLRWEFREASGKCGLRW